jgi:phosphate-selective porin OprO and OprP
MVRHALLRLSIALIASVSSTAQSDDLTKPRGSISDVPSYDSFRIFPDEQQSDGTMPEAGQISLVDDSLAFFEKNRAGEPPDQDQVAAMVDDRPNLEPRFQMRGRIEAEATGAIQNGESKEIIGTLQNGFGFRRVRLGAQGNIDDSASWVSEVELAGGSVRLRDVFVGLDSIPGIRQVRIGHFREPFSLEGMTSSHYITFLERSPSNVISPARNWGVGGYWWTDDERVLFTLGAYRDGTGSNGQSTGDGGNWAYTSRLTALPIFAPDKNDDHLVHVGGAFSHRKPSNGIIDFAPRTGSNLLTVEDNPGSPFLPRVRVAADHYQLYNVQAASVAGPLSFQTEWLAAAVEQPGGPIFIHGVYLFASFFLTGEHRSYNRTRGSFDRIDVINPFLRDTKKSARGTGAIELATRFSYFDFRSANLPLDSDGNPVGTQLYEWSNGCNWYLNSNTRVMLDYTLGLPRKIGAQPTVAHIYGIRTAVYW